MTPEDRARAWFKRHAQIRTGPDGETVAYGVDWSEEVERSLVAEFTVASIPRHEPWVNRTNYVKPRMSFP